MNSLKTLSSLSGRRAEGNNRTMTVEGRLENSSQWSTAEYNGEQRIWRWDCLTDGLIGSVVVRGMNPKREHASLTQEEVAKLV